MTATTGSQPPVVLITGITGQDGGYLAEQLTAQGDEVHGLVRPGEQVPAHLLALGRSVHLHEVELTDPRRLEDVLREIGPSELYNLAGVSSVAQSWQEPGQTAQVNGVLVATLLELVWQLQESTGGPVRFLQASSAEIFAGAAEAPQDEGTPMSPRSPYGAAKAFAHHLVQVYRSRGLHAVNVILYNHESPRRPPSFVTRKITMAAAAIAEGRQDELVLGNLSARRDWGWAPEYAAAMTLAVRYPEPDDYVIGTGESHSVAEFVQQAFLHVGIHDWREVVRSDEEFTRPGDAVDLVGDAGKAAAVLGWTAQTRFADIVGRMVDHDRNQA